MASTERNAHAPIDAPLHLPTLELKEFMSILQFSATCHGIVTLVYVSSNDYKSNLFLKMSLWLLP